MKKKLIIPAAIAVLATLAVYATKAPSGVTDSSLVLASVESLAQTEISSNYGPSKVYECLNGGKRKICECKKGYPPCSETDCF